MPCCSFRKSAGLGWRPSGPTLCVHVCVCVCVCERVQVLRWRSSGAGEHGATNAPLTGLQRGRGSQVAAFRAEEERRLGEELAAEEADRAARRRDRVAAGGRDEASSSESEDSDDEDAHRRKVLARLKGGVKKVRARAACGRVSSP